MKKKQIIIPLLFILMFANIVFAASDFSGNSDVGERFLDVRSFLFRAAEKNDWSLIVSNNVNSPLKEVKGETVKQALDNYFKDTPYGFQLSDNCLYVAAERDLEIFFRTLPELEMILPKGNAKTNFNGVFRNIELPFLCEMLRAISGVEIRTSGKLQMGLMMRAREMSWKRILLAIVYLNRLRINHTDFSIVISPEGV